jgi:phage terminase large subunit-like protein
VVAGRHVVGQLVRLACERHLRDLRDGRRRGLWFDAEEAAAALDFWRLCPHLKGRKWANAKIEPEPWQCFVIGSVYGWKRADGRRRFKVVWVEMGRKNGKSTIAYPAALHNLTVDGEPGAEVYAAATKKDQARIVYDMARRAVLRTPELLEVLTPYAHSVVNERDWSKLEALGADADTLDGLNPSCVICDEVHKWKGRDLWDVIDTATGAREQPLVWVVTTAGAEGEESVYGQEHNYTRQVLEGVVPDDSRFGYIACLDPGDDWTDPANIPKANPNLGVSVQAEEIAAAIEKAKATPVAANAVKRLRLGIRTQDAEAWIPLPLWDAGRVDGVDWGRYRGAACGGGLDLASSCDFAALTLCFPVNADLTPAADYSAPWGYLFRWRLWLPEGWQNPNEKRLREAVRPWLGEWIETTEGDVIDHDAVQAGAEWAAAEYDLRLLCYDPFNATQLAVRLQAAGVKAEAFRQGVATFAEPTKKFGEILGAKRMRHDGNPVARWMADNVVLVRNATGHAMPSRKKSKNKIDGIVSGVMSLGAAMAPTSPEPTLTFL